MTYDRPTEPSGVLGVLTDSFRLYRASIVSLFLLVFLLESIVLAIRPYIYPGAGSEHGFVYWLRLITTYLAGVYMYGFIIAHVHSVASGSSHIGSSLAIALRRLPAMLVVPLIYGIAVLIPPMLILVLHTGLDRLDIMSGIYLVPSLKSLMLLSIIPAVFVAVALFAIFLLPVTEGRGPFESLNRSSSLVRKHWWNTFVIVVIAVAMIAINYTATYAVVLGLSDLLDNIPAGYAISMGTGIALYVIILPLIVCLVYGAYQNLRLHEQSSTP